MKRFLVLLSFLAPTVALAQQQAQPTAQDQLLTICTNVSSNIAKQLDAANARIAELMKQLEAKDKPDTKPKP